MDSYEVRVPTGGPGRAMTARAVVDQVLIAMAPVGADARAGQLEAVEALVREHRRVLVVQATGWGKSLVYWAATMARRAGGAGPTVVISPLLALMRNQIEAAAAAGLRAVSVNSSNLDDWEDVFDQLDRDAVDVLLVSPERLANPRFAHRAMPLLARAGLLVIDEAHCISDWGFDFRPDYQRIAQVLLSLQDDTPVLATTATANERVTADVAAQLGAQTLVLRGPLARSSLRLAVVPGLASVARFAWVHEALCGFDGSGIVYCLTVDEANSLAGFLAGQGHVVAAYTGQTDPQDRARIEDDLRHNRLKAVVATSALGMGYDKPDLAFCVHVGSPSSPVAYYQQVGRAGRALANAHGVLLPAGAADERIWDYFATASLPDPQLARQLIEALSDGPATLVELENATGARRGRVEMMLKQLRVDAVVHHSAGAWSATGKPWHHDAAKYDAILAARRREAALMRDFAYGRRCLMQVLVDALDDPHAAACGRCSVCTGQVPAPGAVPGAESMRAASEYLRRRVRVVEPRKMWPRGCSRKGRIVGAQEGRAVAFADDPGWPEVVAETNSPDAPPTAELVASMVEAVAAWGPERPVAIVAAPDFAHPTRTHGLARELAQHFGIPVLEALRVAGPQPSGDAASGAVVRSLDAAIRVTGQEVAGPVLLVAEAARTRWTLTVAAA
ncbi:MAG: ATP-dependent helicase RecQ, partial [Actinomycetota bacterium]|nr:ATP-dependent helicase RecQ [Actinomycetota bacterium]